MSGTLLFYLPVGDSDFGIEQTILAGTILIRRVDYGNFMAQNKPSLLGHSLLHTGVVGGVTVHTAQNKNVLG